MATAIAVAKESDDETNAKRHVSKNGTFLMKLIADLRPLTADVGKIVEMVGPMTSTFITFGID